MDTSVWSFSLRRKPEDLSRREIAIVAELFELVKEGNVRMIGPVRQELLSGVKTENQYEKLRAKLSAYQDEPLQTADYEYAAKASNQCRAKGVMVSSVDILICATALERGWNIFTTDPDFQKYASVLPVRLHRPRP